MHRLLCLVALGACGGGPSLDTGLSPAIVDPAPFSREVNDRAAWRAAWPTEGGSLVRGGGPGRALGPAGSADVAEFAPCGEFSRMSGDAVLWLPPGPPILFPPAPLVSAAVVERSTWRLSDVLGPNEGIQPGADARDPAIDRGIRVRSVRKTRRQGPPWQVIVGERRDRVAVALADKDADRLVASAILRPTVPGPLEIASLPIEDLDGQGGPELVVYGDGPSGGFRAVYTVDLEAGALDLRSFEEQAKVACPTAP